MQYDIQQFRHLLTGESLVLEIPDSEFERFTRLREKFDNEGWSDREQRTSFLRQWEASLFPAYKKVREIFFENGYTDELVTQILREFGADEDLIKKLLTDTDFVKSVKRWFEGITNDGERTTTTMLAVYGSALEFIRKSRAAAAA